MFQGISHLLYLDLWDILHCYYPHTCTHMDSHLSSDMTQVLCGVDVQFEVYSSFQVGPCIAQVLGVNLEISFERT